MHVHARMCLRGVAFSLFLPIIFHFVMSRVCFSYILFLKVACSFHYATHPAKLQSRVCKIYKIYIFFEKYLHISKKSSTFAPDLKN